MTAQVGISIEERAILEAATSDDEVNAVHRSALTGVLASLTAGVADVPELHGALVQLSSGSVWRVARLQG